MNDVAWRHQQFRTKYLYLLLLVAVLLYGLRPVYTGRMYGSSLVRVSKNAPVYTGRRHIRVTGTHYPYIRPVCTGVKNAPVYTGREYIYIYGLIYGCSVHTTRIEFLFCTGRIYGLYLRVVRIGLKSISRRVTSGWLYCIPVWPRSQGCWRVLIVKWCCYNCSCPPHVKSQASSSAVRVSQSTWRLRQSTFPS